MDNIHEKFDLAIQDLKSKNYTVSDVWYGIVTEDGIATPSVVITVPRRKKFPTTPKMWRKDIRTSSDRSRKYYTFSLKFDFSGISKPMTAKDFEEILMRRYQSFYDWAINQEAL